MGVANIIIDIAVRNRNASGEIDRTASSADQFSQSMGAMVGPAKVAAVAIGGVAAAAIKYASDAQQAHGGVDAVFKTSADTIHQWAKSSAQDVGLAGAEYETMAAGIGGALSGMGVPLEAATAQTGDLITRAADLASVFGGTTTQATEAVTSAFRGEYDSLQRLIPSISDAAIKQEMAAEAAQGQTFASEEAAKASAIYNTIMKKSGDAAGNFAKEADTAAGSQQRAQAQFKDTAAALGEQLLPAVTAVMGYLSQFGMWISEHIPLVTTLGAVIGGLALAVLAINAGLAVYSAVQTAAAVASSLWAAASGIAAAATTAFGVAMAILTSPITLIILAIAALVAGIILLVKNWDTVAAAAGAAWDFIVKAVGAAVDWIKTTAGAAIDWLKSAWSSFGSWIGGIWDSIKSAAATVWEVIKTILFAPIIALQLAWEAWGDDIMAIWEGIKTFATGIWSGIKSAATAALGAIKSIIDGIKRAIDAVINGIKSALSFASSLLSKIPFIGGLFSTGSSAAPASASRYWVSAQSTPSAMAYGASSSRGRQATINAPQITITGALDPVAVAKQVRALLSAQERRTGAVRV